MLLHGFSGWGRDEALGFYYWGGIVDVERYGSIAGLGSLSELR
jgi:hypothetical protein